MTGRSAAVNGGVGVGLLLAVALGLEGCSVPNAPVSTASPAASMSAASLIAGGTAEQNLPYFEQVLRSVAEPDPHVPGSKVVEALIAAGFSKNAMQLTSDKTSMGLQADSVQVSVALSGSCLIGQYGTKSAGVRAVVMAPIATGACLIGQTVPLGR
ncbi:hypothetical protein C5C66_05775 [Rathayibacter toxicus]|uniref:DUF6993 domain-containing protein n=1 Tax=Rathayibacter toxicus TaxID=145458 RepID=UPI000695FD91|nr:hypothetical protein [Rathayibacter toxicus]ALS56462.1 hypothetical protein APU90_00520 [Rathayibacter toxicus]PPG21719.1 hypothetical protein C5D15_05760 [Rathayibacter toxicus]PPG46681.1 hypothetical protein C5D16_05735 [Rathayibacter toxicus]PPH63563.1 hypothetical protein C5D13_05830 [Rathayibacter toxicus]PPH67907.1 hypothetical protein C5D01_05800 [Rathayibacter toxicus]